MPITQIAGTVATQPEFRSTTGDKQVDRYASFYELARTEVLGEDYAIESLDRQSEVIVVAPHGGWIEPGTTEITKAIADGELSYYVFIGLKPGRRHEDLHVSSERFDEPTA